MLFIFGDFSHVHIDIKILGFQKRGSFLVSSQRSRDNRQIICHCLWGHFQVRAVQAKYQYSERQYRVVVRSGSSWWSYLLNILRHSLDQNSLRISAESFFILFSLLTTYTNRSQTFRPVITLITTMTQCTRQPTT